MHLYARREQRVPEAEDGPHGLHTRTPDEAMWRAEAQVQVPASECGSANVRAVPFSPCSHVVHARLARRKVVGELGVAHLALEDGSLVPGLHALGERRDVLDIFAPRKAAIGEWGCERNHLREVVDGHGGGLWRGGQGGEGRTGIKRTGQEEGTCTLSVQAWWIV